eukprot:TRINITY_DN3937_c1_g1_i2.p1 TRINITY_DN3937_c1_g1~~TRINITY_DN3937_c1_g1_i2.p1  ORF type:complete len:228 (+),score=45.10 TRINITY_DN3937_c1_g1_i2:1-684(+)
MCFRFKTFFSSSSFSFFSFFFLFALLLPAMSVSLPAGAPREEALTHAVVCESSYQMLMERLFAVCGFEGTAFMEWERGFRENTNMLRLLCALDCKELPAPPFLLRLEGKSWWFDESLQRRWVIESEADGNIETVLENMGFKLCHEFARKGVTFVSPDEIRVRVFQIFQKRGEDSAWRLYHEGKYVIEASVERKGKRNAEADLLQFFHDLQPLIEPVKIKRNMVPVFG